MAITDYSDLKTEIFAMMFDEGGAVLAGSVDNCISFAEARFNYGSEAPFPTPALRVAQMETDATLTLTSGAATLPTDYLEWRDVTALTSPTRGLSFLSPASLGSLYETTYAAPPVHFSIGSGSLKVRPTTSSNIRFTYYQKIPALSDANTSNWLLAAMPNLYLYACCLEASIFREDAERASQMLGLVSGLMAGLTSSDKGARWARGTARVAGMVCP